MRYYKVENSNNLMRDVDTNAIVNTNMTEYEQYKKITTLKNEENQKMKKIEDDLNSVKDDINEIKKLLLKISNET